MNAHAQDGLAHRSLPRGRSGRSGTTRAGLSLEEELELAREMDAARAALLASLVADRVMRERLAALQAEHRLLRSRQEVEVGLAEERLTELLALAAGGAAFAALEPAAERVVELAVLQEDVQHTLVAELLAGSGTAMCVARARRAAAAFDAARGKLVTANLSLARYLALSVTGRGVGVDDLVQEGFAGLLRAADRYDHRRGLRFNTYAVWWIRSTLRVALLERGRTVHVPTRQLQARRRLGALEGALRQKLGRDATVAELAAGSGLEVSDVEELLLLPRGTSSLDVDDDVPGGGLHDRLAADTEPPEQGVDSARAQSAARASLATLPARDALVLRLRFGLENGREHTLAEVGEVLGVTRERARQLEVRALERLRTQLADHAP